MTSSPTTSPRSADAASGERRTALRAVIFDVDGTLAETELAGHLPAFNQAFAEAGLDWQWSVGEYLELLAVAGGKERIAHYARLRHPEFAARGDFADRVAHLQQRKTEIYVALAASGAIPLRPGIARLLDAIAASGIFAAIATTTTPASLFALLKSQLGADALQRFAFIGAGDIVPRKKPAADIYLHVLEQLGLTAAECIAIEDSAIGTAAARAAGIAVLVTTHAGTAGEDFSGAIAVIDGLGEPGHRVTSRTGMSPAGEHVVLADLVRWHAASNIH